MVAWPLGNRTEPARSVELVLRKLGAGISPEAILVDHPRLTLDDIRAAQGMEVHRLLGR